mmetsp:Transcript_3091/g.4556  ORF Transcript_3091/g.4556 Transcript_3091/m.4556 type:complete len:265 (+) Transcript_3091:309-1103(+)
MKTTGFLLVITLLNLSSHFLLAASKLQPMQSTVFELTLIVGPPEIFALVFGPSPPPASISCANAFCAIFDILLPLLFDFGDSGTNDVGRKATSVSFICICMPLTLTTTRLPLTFMTVASLPLSAPFLHITKISPALRFGFSLNSARGTISANFSAATAAAASFFLKTLGIFSASVRASLLTYRSSSQLFAINFFEGLDLRVCIISCRITSFSSSLAANFFASSRRAFTCCLSNFSCFFSIVCSNSSRSFRFCSNSRACWSMTNF